MQMVTDCNKNGRKEFPWICTRCRKFEIQTDDKIDTNEIDQKQLPEENETIQNKHRNDFLILHYNCRSLQNKFLEIHNICNLLKPSILCLTETWLDPSHGPQAYLPTGYSIIRKDRSTEFKQKYMKNNGGGVAILIKNGLKFRKLKNHIEPEESIWIEVKAKAPFILGVVYRSEYCDLLIETENETPLEKQLNEMLQINRNLMIIGDLNCDTALKSEQKSTSKLLEVLEGLSLTQLINKPTRIDQKSRKWTTIDHIWTDEKQKLVKNSGTIEGISDHSGTYATINSTKEKLQPEKFQFRCYKNYNSKDFNTDLEEALRDPNLNQLIAEEKVNEATEKWVNIFVETAGKHAPIKEGTSSNKTKIIPWFTSELKTLIDERRTRLKLYLLDGFLSDLNIMKTLTNKINQYKRKLKKIYYKEQITKYEGDPNKLWQILKEVTQTKISNKNEIEPELLDQTKVNNFNKFYATVGSKIQEKLKIKEKDPLTETPGKFEFRDVNEETTIKLIDRIRTNVAVGHDNIHARLLKDSKMTIAKTLTQLVNISYKKAIFPTCMKKGIVRPIYKKDDPEDPGNYRPITILSTLSKVFERSAADQQMEYYMTNQILNGTNHAYIRGHSTETCLHEIVNFIYRENDKGNLVGIASMDLSKAFDSISHSHLIHKLSTLGLGPKSLKWCKSYLTARKQQTRFKKFISEEEFVTSGVPQGSILGPLLFISFLNDLPSYFQNCKIVSYADDTQLLVTAKNGKEIKNLLENVINTAQKWYAKNSLLNNATKTEIMLITGRKHNEKFYIEILDEGKKKKLELKESIKILGVHLDHKLNWSKHVQEVNKKANYAVRNLQRVNMLIPFKPRILLYNSLIASHFNYADTVWAGCSMKDQNKLQRTQNLAVKSILGMRKNESARDALKTAKLLPLAEKRKIHEGVFIHKGLQNKLPLSVCKQYAQHKTSNNSRSSERKILGIPPHKSEKFKSSPLYRTITTWNSIPQKIKEIENMDTFKRNYQKHCQEVFRM